MAEKNYDVWNDGFLGSGFEEESANALRLASERAVCSVRRDAKKKDELAVSLCLRGESSGSKEIARCALPDKAVDFFDFSVQLAKGLFGTRRRYAPFGREVLPRDLADLVENGFDYLGDDSAGKDAPDEPMPEGDDGFDALVAKLSRVIGAAREASDEQIHAATKAHDYAKGGKAMEKSARLQTLQELLDDFAAKWKAEGLGLSLKVEVLQKVKEDKTPRRRGRPPKNAAKNALKKTAKKKANDDGVKVGRIVQWAFPLLFEQNRITDAEIAELLSDESIKAFKTRGFPVLKAYDARETDMRHYYAKLLLEHGGKTYRLTTEFITENRERVMAWLEKKGFSREELEKAGRGLIDKGTEGLDLFDSAKNETTSLSTSSFSAALQEAMNRQNLSKGGLAKKLGVSRQDVRNWCKGYGEISRSNYASLCRALGVDSLG